MVSRRAIGFVFRQWTISATCWEPASHTCKESSDGMSPRGTPSTISERTSGMFLFLWRSRLDPSGQVIAFEPIPRNAQCLRESIEVNRLTNVKLLEFAASDQCGDAVIRIAENLSTPSLVWHRDNPSATQLTIRTVQIDQLVESGTLAYPRFVKIDVEGAEGSVLKGMQRTVAVAKPILFIECSDSGRETTWTLLRELGYQCQSALTLKQVDSFDEYRHSDFLWLPPRAPQIT